MNAASSDSSSRPPKLLDQLRDCIRAKHYSIRTEQAYVQWMKGAKLAIVLRIEGLHMSKSISPHGNLSPSLTPTPFPALGIILSPRRTTRRSA